MLVVMAFGFVHQQWISELPSYFFQTVIFLLFGTSLLYLYLYKFNKPDFFVQFYLLTMGVKLIAYGAYNFVVIMQDKKGATQNVVWFITLYIIFTVLEVGFLHRKITNQ